MGGMDMGALGSAVKRAQQQGGLQFADVERAVVEDGLVVRLVGNMASAWEHFVDTPKGARPVYCAGPDSDCAICNLVSVWAHSDDEGLQKNSGEMKAKEKFYFNCLIRSTVGKQWHAEHKKTRILAQNAKGMNIGPMLLQSIGQVCQMLQDQDQDNDPNGFDLRLGKTGEGIGTRYSAQFTGKTDILTDEELQYEQYDLNELSAITPQAESAAIVQYMNASPEERMAVDKEQTSFNPEQLEKQKPQDVAKTAMGGVAPGPAPAAAPAAAPAPAPAPAIQPQVQYEDTSPQDTFDSKTHYKVPCTECNAIMQISMQPTGRNLQCHGCGRVYGHPNA